MNIHYVIHSLYICYILVDLMLLVRLISKHKKLMKPHVFWMFVFVIMTDALVNALATIMVWETQTPHDASIVSKAMLMFLLCILFIFFTQKELTIAMHNAEVYRILFRQNPIPSMLVDKKGNIREVNQWALKLLGSPSDAETKQINVLTFPPLVDSGVSEAVRGALEGNSLRTKIFYTSKWGRRTIFDLYTTPFYNIRGKLIGCELIASDITELEDARVEALMNHKFLGAVLNASQSLIFVRDSSHKIVLANQAFADACGKSHPDEVIGQNDYSLLGDMDQQELIIREDNEVLSTRNKLVIPERKLVFADGTIEWMQIVKQPLNGNYVVGVATSITALKNVVDALRISEAKYKELLEITKTLTIQIDRNRTITYASQASIDLLGIRPENLIGKDWINIIHPDDAPIVGRTFSRWTFGTRKHEQLTSRIVTASGHEKWVLWNVTLLFDETTFHGLTASGSDVTTQKVLEYQIKLERAQYKAISDTFTYYLEAINANG